ncbi:MAG: hypothetical protein K0Q73_2427 [Paenibacillus sp.]|nr:hypothetical protein [Paenibacillus sp.]
MGLLFHQPEWLVFMFVIYLLSFLLKAAAWRIYAGPEVRFSIYFRICVIGRGLHLEANLRMLAM